MSTFYISEAHEYKSDLFYIYTCTLHGNQRRRSNEKSVYKKCPKQEINVELKCILTTEKAQVLKYITMQKM